MAEGMRRQLCDDAMTMLVLWATKQDYDPAVESLLNEWSSILGVPQAALNEKVDLAMGANLPRPVLGRYAQRSAGGAAPAAPAPRAAPAPAPRPGGGGGGGGQKRRVSSDSGGGGGSKKAKTAGASADLKVFEGVTKAEAMVGRKVKRYWPDDAAKNKGDPWFMAVVTDYDPVLKIHVLTYSLGTQKEEREDVNLSTLHQGSISFTGDWIDLERWYADPKRREKSYAVKAR